MMDINIGDRLVYIKDVGYCGALIVGDIYEVVLVYDNGDGQRYLDVRGGVWLYEIDRFMSIDSYRSMIIDDILF